MLGDPGTGPGMWGRDGLTENGSPRLPRCGAERSAVSVPSQHPKAAGASEGLSVPPADSPPGLPAQATPHAFLSANCSPPGLGEEEALCVNHCLLPASPRRFLQGFWCPQGHSAPVETIPQGSSPRLFSPLNHAFFCPYLVPIWLLGSHPGRVCRGKPGQVLTGASSSSPGVR